MSEHDRQGLKTNLLRRALAGALIGSALAARGAGGPALAQQPPPAPALSPDVPADVVLPTDGPFPIEAFDDFAWRMFVAVSWPADVTGGKRGVPRRDRRIGDLSSPTVWSTWKTDFEVLQPGQAEPSAWASDRGKTPCGGDSLPIGATMLGAFSDPHSRYFGLNQAGQGTEVGPLVAQNGTYTRYEIRVNQPEYETILGAPVDGNPRPRLYRRDDLDKVKSGSALAVAFPFGSMAVKAAWREVKPDEIGRARGRYYIVEAAVKDPVGGTCQKKSMALVGLHIVQRTPKRPQWVWSSFEHVDNVPGMNGGRAPYSYNDGTGTKQPDWTAYPKAISADNQPVSAPAPFQAERLRGIHPSTAATNAKYQKLLQGTVWENYALVMTQWPENRTVDSGKPIPEDEPTNPKDTTLRDETNLANTTMETYFQGPRDPTRPRARMSCMKCHDKARQNNLGFVFFGTPTRLVGA